MGNNFSCCFSKNSCRVVPISLPNQNQTPNCQIALSKRNQSLQERVKLASKMFAVDQPHTASENEYSHADRPKNPSPQEREQSTVFGCSQASTDNSAYSLESLGIGGKGELQFRRQMHEKIETTVGETGETGYGKATNNDKTVESQNMKENNHGHKESQTKMTNREKKVLSSVEAARSSGKDVSVTNQGQSVRSKGDAEIDSMYENDTTKNSTQHIKYVSPLFTSDTPITITNNRQNPLIPGISSRGYISSELNTIARPNVNNRPMASYSRHLVDDAKQRSISSVRATSLDIQSNKSNSKEFISNQSNPSSSKNRSLISGGQQWHRQTTVSTPVGQRSSRFSWQNTFDIAKSAKVSYCLPPPIESEVDLADYLLEDDEMQYLDESDDQIAKGNKDAEEEWVSSTPARQNFGKVTRINVQPAENMDEPFICRHGKSRLSCTFCNRPTGRCGREFKNRQDNENKSREARRRKERQKTKFC